MGEGLRNSDISFYYRQDGCWCVWYKHNSAVMKSNLSFEQSQVTLKFTKPIITPVCAVDLIEGLNQSFHDLREHSVLICSDTPCDMKANENKRST